MERNQKKNENESKFRGLMSSNEFPKETKHKGSSRFESVWESFADDFTLSVPNEFYTSTENKKQGKPSSPC